MGPNVSLPLSVGLNHRIDGKPRSVQCDYFRIHPAGTGLPISQALGTIAAHAVCRCRAFVVETREDGVDIGEGPPARALTAAIVGEDNCE